MKIDFRCMLPAVTLFAICLVSMTATLASGQTFVSNSRLVLGVEENRSASIRMGDLDGDKDLDVVIANGRHWPGQNYVLLNDGRSRFTVKRPLGADLSTSYACELADFDGDGDLDIATGNDQAPCQIFLNNGHAEFSFHENFGKVSSLRSMTIADIDQDGDQDILVTCRGRSNWIFRNDGHARFDEGVEFGTAKDSTIAVAVGDVNQDGHLDLVLANRDGQPNAWLIHDGRLNFSKPKHFGNAQSQSRAVVLGDFNGDKKLDWAIGNIGQPNRVFLGDGRGGVMQSTSFGGANERTYCLAAADIDLDGDLDLVAGNAGQPNTVFFNDGQATQFRAESFGSATHATYGLSLGDLNGDGLPDVAVANSDAINSVFLNRIRKSLAKPLAPSANKSLATPKQAPQSLATDSATRPPLTSGKSDAKAPGTTTVEPMARDLKTFQSRPVYRTSNWPAFRGKGGRGVAEGYSLPTEWNLDTQAGDLRNIAWHVKVPGLGHSSPVIMDQQLYLLTAVARDGQAPLQVESGGKPTAADDTGIQDWLLLCYDKRSGKQIWQRTLKQGVPRATRHAKATHANTSVFVSGEKVIAFLGSEGLYAFDRQGRKLWDQDLGVINISKYGIGWGFSSSPVVHDQHILLVCDDPQNPFLAAHRLSDGQQIWRTSRKGICERSWGTPLVHQEKDRTQVVVNGWPWIVSYDLSSGKELWRVKGGGDNPVPTPFEAHGLFYITNAHGGPSPIFAIRPQASGDLTSKPADPTGKAAPIAWRIERGGSYMSTPVVYGDQIYVGSAKGILRSFDAFSGRPLFEDRLGIRAGVIASLVAGDGKIYCASENGSVYALEHGPKFKLLSENKMGAPCLATPAISAGSLFIRTTQKLVAVKLKGSSDEHK